MIRTEVSRVQMVPRPIINVVFDNQSPQRVKGKGEVKGNQSHVNRMFSV